MPDPIQEIQSLNNLENTALWIGLLFCTASAVFAAFGLIEGVVF